MVWPTILLMRNGFKNLSYTVLILIIVFFLGFMISLKIIHGTLDEVKKNYPTLIKSAALTQKRWFSHVIMPGDVRNDLYLSLEMAEFEKGGKNVGKNVQASAVVVDQDGEILQVSTYFTGIKPTRLGRGSFSGNW